MKKFTTSFLILFSNMLCTTFSPKTASPHLQSQQKRLNLFSPILFATLNTHTKKADSHTEATKNAAAAATTTPLKVYPLIMM